MEITSVHLTEISALAKRQVACEKAVEAAKANLAACTETLAYVQELLLPNAMLEAGLSSFTLDSGEAIEVVRTIHASISEERFPLAKAWLNENGYGGNIKHVVSLSFGKGEDESATTAIEALVEAGFKPIDKESIHPSTLKATVKEMLGEGVDVPLDIFGVHEVVKAKVTVK